ncbi:MAG TPA: Ig-like domain-containing protein [Mycobacteriales bacterium]|nr:Ig-like domain-containing protein [Mycobacteriales bacterium]
MKRPLLSIAAPLAVACAAGSLAFAAPASARPLATSPTLVEGPIYDDPGTYSYVVPAGVTRIVADVEGSYGGNGGSGATTTVGGPGDIVEIDFASTPGSTLNIIVGAPGNNGCQTACSDPNAGVGGAGYGKGGDGSSSGSSIGGGGGGASSLAVNGATPIAVAAGGGGGGATTDYQASGSPAAGNDGGAGDDGAIPAGSGGGGGGAPGGAGGTLGSGGHAGSDVGPYKGSNCTQSGSDCTRMGGRVQLAYYEPGFALNDDEYSVKQGTTLDVPAPGVLKNDTTYGVAPQLARKPLHGAVVLNSDGSFTYKPAEAFTGYDTFTYTLQNTHSSNVATVTILVGKVAAGALTGIGTPGQGRLLLDLACGSTGKCPFDVAILKKVGGSNRRIAHGTTTFLPKRSGVFGFKLPQKARVTYGTGKNHVVHAQLYITLHRKGQKVIVIANRPITIK